MGKIVSIVGARPQFIKLSPLSKELRKKYNEVIVHTGQHYDSHMSQMFFDELEIPKPDYNLNVGSGSHGEQTGEMLKRIESVLLMEKPDLVIVYGDTNSTLAGALAAVKLHIKIAHVEAGVRSFNKKMPEEVNRIITDHISDFLFVPTENAVRNLKKEGVQEGVYNVGDVMLDAFLKYSILVKKDSDILRELDLDKKGFYLLTVHRQENTSNKKALTNIFEALSGLEKRVVFPVHPRTKKYLKSYNLLQKIKKTNIRLSPPLSYLNFLSLFIHAEMIITDSGGVQKEAYFAKTPCITLRNETEWIETVEDGWNILVGTEKEKIIEAIRNFKPKDNVNYRKFGNGLASKRIFNKISEILDKQ